MYIQLPRARYSSADAFCISDYRTGKDELLDTAMALHDAALKDDFFVKRRLAPNVDFWSGLIYRAMGEPSFLNSCAAKCNFDGN